MQRRRVKISKELQAAIAIQNEANKAAKVESRKPQWAIRAEANVVRREMKHDAMMTKARRSYFEKMRQAALTVDRLKIKARQVRDQILSGLPDQEKKTELGIVLPSGEQVSRVRR